MLRVMLALALAGLIGGTVNADEPKIQPDVEKIPAPKLKVEPAVILTPPYQRSDTREVWQHYGVNAFGRFVPRVIVLPHGAYYSRDLQPYPWSQNRPTAVLPTRVN